MARFYRPCSSHIAIKDHTIPSCHIRALFTFNAQKSVRISVFFTGPAPSHQSSSVHCINRDRPTDITTRPGTSSKFADGNLNQYQIHQLTYRGRHKRFCAANIAEISNCSRGEIQYGFVSSNWRFQ